MFLVTFYDNTLQYTFSNLHLFFMIFLDPKLSQALGYCCSDIRWENAVENADNTSL